MKRKQLLAPNAAEPGKGFQSTGGRRRRNPARGPLRGPFQVISFKRRGRRRTYLAGWIA